MSARSVGRRKRGSEIQHPLYRIPSATLPTFIRLGVVATLLVGLPLLGAIESGPGFERLARLVLAGNPSRADAVLRSWSEADRLHIAFANGLDYLFGILLFGTLAMGCTWVGQRGPSSRVRRASVILVWLASLAVVLDIPENAAYLAMVHGDTKAPWPQLAVVACTARVAIFLLCSIFVGGALVGRLRAA